MTYRAFASSFHVASFLVHGCILLLHVGDSGSSTGVLRRTVHFCHAVDLDGVPLLCTVWCHMGCLGRHMFEVEQVDYDKEQIDWSYITFNDNKVRCCIMTSSDVAVVSWGRFEGWGIELHERRCQ